MANLGLSGIASGVDTSAIVDQLMALERQKVTRLGYRKSSVTGQQDALKEIASKLAALKDAAVALSADATFKQSQSLETSDPTRVGATLMAGAGIGGQTIQVDRLASSAQRRYSFDSTSGGTLTLFYGGDPNAAGAAKVDVTVAAGATMQQVADAINAKTGGPALAAVVKGPDGEHLVLSARKTGASSDFTVQGAGVLTEDPTFQRLTGNDLNAAYRLNGAATPSYWESNVIEHAIPGVRLTLKGVTTSPATVTVGEPALDRTAIKDKVKAFVAAYNAVVDTTRTKLAEQPAANPTSEFQAQRGQLFGDTALNGMLGALRAQMTELVEGTGINDLADLGISVPRASGGVSTADAKAGRLVLDEGKLTAALDGDWTAVQGFLKTFSSEAEAFVKKQTGGSGVIDDRLKNSNTTLDRLQDQIDRTNERLDAKEKRMRAQFAAMEVALQNAQSQQAWLTGQLSALNTQS
jgi:flagellar hook-associated protein 2